MKSMGNKAVVGILALVMITAFSGRPLFAAPPPCKVEAQISPNNQNVDELSIVQLNGQPSKDTTSYLWEQVSGPTVTLNDPHAAKPTFTAPEVGLDGAVLLFKLTASGCSPVQENSINTTVNVKDVSQQNRPPVASATASPNPVFEGGLVTLDGTASSDPDGDNLVYSWSQLPGGTPVTLTPDATGAMATFTAPDVGIAGETLVFRLKVIDSGGLEATADVTLNVQWVNAPPIAALTCPESVNEGDMATLDGSKSSDPDDGIASFAWIQLLGPPDVDVTAFTESVISFVAPHLGLHQDGKLPFKLTVTDLGNLSATAECTVTINDITPPEFSGVGDLVKEATSAAGAAADFNPTAFDAVDGDIEDVICDPLSGSTFPIGTTGVICKASDKAGNTATAEFDVTVQDTTPPTIDPLSDISTMATSAAGADVIFSNPATHDIVDGEGIAKCTPESGTFPVGVTTVTCTATDSHENIAESTFKVFVIYNWTGFFRPVDNMPVVNSAKAGSAIPVKFALGGYMGGEIFAPGYPRSVAINADGLVQEISAEETVTAGGSSLNFDTLTNQYIYVWKTDKTWSGGRQLQIMLKDGTSHFINFKFSK